MIDPKGYLDDRPQRDTMIIDPKGHHDDRPQGTTLSTIYSSSVDDLAMIHSCHTVVHSYDTHHFTLYNITTNALQCHTSYQLLSDVERQKVKQ